MNSREKKPPKDARKERLARELRANLARRKQQARERGAEHDDGATAVDGERESSRRDT
ncbi:MAG: hypothetical protein JJ913_09160 [Rhizobiaceae bacterium]|nr:hypothetical protein [Rhizobiaceae bacterium]